MQGRILAGSCEAPRVRQRDGVERKEKRERGMGGRFLSHPPVTICYFLAPRRLGIALRSWHPLFSHLSRIAPIDLSLIMSLRRSTLISKPKVA